MTGIIRYYLDFSGYFLSGFDVGYVFENGHETFPMWGYGMVLLITQNKFLIICVQQLFTIFTIYYSIRVLRQLFDSEQIVLWLKILLLFFGYSWFIFHTPIWPYSLSANLFIISILLLAQAVQKNGLKEYLLSAIFYGIVLNFRSDYLFLYFCLTPILLVYVLFTQKSAFAKVLIWAGTIFIFLIPWGIYTQSKTGSFLMNSTNGGHYLIVSLGQLPNNVWGFTPKDGDPKMKALVEDQLGVGVSTLSYEGDKLLKTAWAERVKAEPVEFLKKCGNSVYMLFTRPFAQGHLYKTFIRDEAQQQAMKEAIQNDLKNKDFIGLFKRLFSPKYSGFSIPLVLNALSILFYLFLLVVIFFGLYHYKLEVFKSWFLICLIAILGYQFAFQTLGLYGENYHTNVFLFYLFLAAIILGQKTKILDEAQPVVES